MATSAFKSTTKRTTIVKSTGEDSSSSNRTSSHQRARSLSRLSRRVPQAEFDDEEPTLAPPTRGRFVDKLRGSRFPEISLNDLATELFDSSLRGRSNSRNAEVSLRIGGGDGATQRRGRSVSRHKSRSTGANSGAAGRGVSESANSRRRRSLSVARYQISGSESDLGHSHNSSKPGNIKRSMGGNSQISSIHKPTAPNHRPGLRRSLSQKDLNCHNGYSAERPTGDVDTDLYRAIPKDCRHAVEEIKMKLEQSEKCKQGFLAEILLEEQHGKELTRIFKGLIPKTKNSAVGKEKPARMRKRSNDGHRMSRRLTEEAEKHIEEFISNVEDTDISSLDGEGSDTSSSLGGITKTPTLQGTPVRPVPAEMNGVVLPWLQWETSNDASPLPCKNNWDATQEATLARDSVNHFTNSSGNWSPFPDCTSVNRKYYGSRFGEPGNHRSHFPLKGTKRLQLDVDDYLKAKSSEDLLYETWSQRQRICSGGLLLVIRCSPGKNLIL